MVDQEPTNDLYKKEFNRIFGKKEKTLHEMLWKVMKKKKNVEEEEWDYRRN